MEKINNLDKIKDKLWRIQHFYKIKSKSRKILNLRFNPTQKTIIKSIENQNTIRSFTLKSRQMGISTFWLLWWLDDTIFRANTNTAILAHKWESLKYLMDIIRFAYDSMPKEFKPRLGSDSAHELSFKDINSKIFVALSIRSTTIHNLHISEWCFCDDEEIRASLGAVTPDGNISGESTGNGIGNDGYLTYTEGKLGLNEYKTLFFPWFLDPNYKEEVGESKKIELTNEEKKFTQMVQSEYKLKISDEQILWRRKTKKAQRELFGREFPENEDDAFASGIDRFFDMKKAYTLLKEAKEYARTHNYEEKTEDYTCFEKPQKYDLYVAGADTAEGFHDYSVLKIINVTKRREAFVYKARCGVDNFYKICNEWGRKYNNALLAVERNNHGHAVLMGLDENCKYPNLYKQDNFRLGLSSDKLGWQTDKLSKNLMLDELKFALEGDSTEDAEHFKTEIQFFDLELLRELLTFISINGKLGAEEGQYDDDIIATAIALQMYKLMRKYAFKNENFGIIAAENREQR